MNRALVGSPARDYLFSYPTYPLNPTLSVMNWSFLALGNADSSLIAQMPGEID